MHPDDEQTLFDRLDDCGDPIPHNSRIKLGLPRGCTFAEAVAEVAQNVGKAIRSKVLRYVPPEEFEEIMSSGEYEHLQVHDDMILDMPSIAGKAMVARQFEST